MLCFRDCRAEISANLDSNDYIHNAQENDESSQVQELSIFRAEEVSAMRIVEVE
jgi:hypothetical protein